MKNKFSINLEVTLVEIILSVLIFAIAGVISLNCFFIARFTQIKANDKVIAGNLIQSNIEIIKSLNSSDEAEDFLLHNFKLLKSENNVHTYINFYDKSWKLSNDVDNEYFITVNISDEFSNNGTLMDIELIAERIKPYPFLNKNNNNQAIYTIETNKFFPSY
ncbi:hypothetical protein [Sedimentibacter sp.]|uniref:hypothetical protein n=1 Tax=Sedimentibacter sp. TaxID=1960295 RepID=UPI0028AD55D3|nr:hypothetical protein [Sedimentibacter sp.]